MHAVPDTVNNLTVRETDDELLILWTGQEGDISHYTVTAYQADGVYHQFNTSKFKLYLAISKDMFGVGRQPIVQIHVSAANTAGVGQATVALLKQQGKENMQYTHTYAHIETCAPSFCHSHQYISIYKTFNHPHAREG